MQRPQQRRPLSEGMPPRACRHILGLLGRHVNHSIRLLRLGRKGLANRNSGNCYGFCWGFCRRAFCQGTSALCEFGQEGGTKGAWVAEAGPDQATTVGVLSIRAETSFLEGAGAFSARSPPSTDRTQISGGQPSGGKGCCDKCGTWREPSRLYSGC